MLLIYQRATRVVAWLGSFQEDLGKALALASSAHTRLDGVTGFELFRTPASAKDFDFWSVHRGMTDLYTRPWFRRIWVQQEIFAARSLWFQCGHIGFNWSGLLSNPKRLYWLPDLKSYCQLEEDEETATTDADSENPPDDIKAQLDAVSSLDQLHMRYIHCFEKFSPKNCPQPELVDTLLRTGLLGATDPKDYIYAIIGMTRFPTKAMTVQEWTKARKHHTFIPIDYSADLTSILCAVTWALISRESLDIVAKFKAISAADSVTCEQPLPSWVVDWRLAATLFSEVRPNSSTYPSRWGTKIHNESSVTHTKLVLPGCKIPYLYAKDKGIWNITPGAVDRLIWDLEIDVSPTDVIVSYSREADLWVMRPVDNDEYRILAHLDTYPRQSEEKRYGNWKWEPGHFQRSSPQSYPINCYHWLGSSVRKDAEDEAELIRYRRLPIHHDFKDVRTFTIV